jgi:hypothetical protein
MFLQFFCHVLIFLLKNKLSLIAKNSNKIVIYFEN